jgi:hypothetical protein
MKSLLLLSLLGLLVSACSPGAPTAARATETLSLPSATPPPPSETTVSTETPSPVPPTDTSSPTSAFESFPGVACCRGRAVEPGQYALPAWLDLPLTLELGEGWRVMNEAAAKLFLLAGEGRNELGDPSQVLVFIAIPDAKPQEVLASIRDAPELVPAGEITETTVAGFSGWQFEAQATPNPTNKGNPANSVPAGSQFLPALGKYFAPGFLWGTWSAEPTLRFIALDMGEHVLLIVIESPPGEFEAFASQADEVLRSMKR